MIVKSATGDVDLSVPENVRRGMVFESDTCLIVWRPGECSLRVLAREIGDGFWRFLGCDPSVADRADCEQFGLAPSVDAGAHGFARTREGFAVDLRRARRLRGAVIQASGTLRLTLTHCQPFALAEGQRFIGLDATHARAEDVERLCCGAEDPDDFAPGQARCSLAIGDHDAHEDIAAGVRWAAKVVPPDASKWTPAPSVRDVAAWRQRAATPGTAENVQLRAMEAEVQRLAGNCGSGPASVKAALDKIAEPTWTRSATGYETTVRGYKVAVKPAGGPWRYEVSDWAGLICGQMATEQEAKARALRVVPEQPSRPMTFHEGPTATGSLAFTVNGKTETVRYERETTSEKMHKALDALLAADPHASAMVAESVQLRSVAQRAAAVINASATTWTASCPDTVTEAEWRKTLDGLWARWGGGDPALFVTQALVAFGFANYTTRPQPGTVRIETTGPVAWQVALEGWLRDNGHIAINYEVTGPAAKETTMKLRHVEATDAQPVVAMSRADVDARNAEALYVWGVPTVTAPTILSIDVGAVKPGTTIVLRAPGGPTVDLTPQAAALRAALSTIDALTWSAADKRALRDAAHAVAEMAEATDGKAPAALRGPVTETLAALASAAHVGTAVIGEAVKARDAARAAMGRR